MKEIERKFLLKKNFSIDSIQYEEKKEIKQGYLHNSLNLRIRIINNIKAVMTYKEGFGLERGEYEVDFPIEMANNIFKESLKIIEKVRYLYKEKDGNIWELDYFPKKDLWLAEIELKNKDQNFKKPSFILKEVTNNSEYENFNLAK